MFQPLNGYLQGIHLTHSNSKVNKMSHQMWGGGGKAVLLQARRGPEGSRKLMFPDFVTAALDGDRLSALRTGRLYLFTPWCRVLLEKLTGLQLVKKFPAFHGTRRFIAALTSVRHLSLSWASPIQSIYPHPTSWRSILILSTIYA